MDPARQKKTLVIHNSHGPLLPSIKRGPNSQAKELDALSKTLGDPFQDEVSALTYPTVIERLENAEEHLHLIIGTCPGPCLYST